MFDLDGLAQTMRERSVRRAGRVALALKIGLVVCSSLAAVSHFAAWYGVGISASVLAAVLGGLLIYLDRDATDDLWKAENALASAKNRQEALDAKEREIGTLIDNQAASFEEYDRETMRFANLYTAGSGFHDIVLKAPIPAAVSVVDTIMEMLHVHGQFLAISAGFKMEEFWTISVYRADSEEGATVLRPIAQHRSSHCDLAKARVYPEGYGVVGVAYQRARDQIVPDILSAVVHDLYSLGALTHAGDDDHFRSFAAIPIRARPGVRPWGVAIATSNVPDHFNEMPHRGLPPHEVMRTLAGVVALAVRTNDFANGKEPL